jgi:hypothetical protein
MGYVPLRVEIVSKLESKNVMMEIHTIMMDVQPLAPSSNVM